MILRSRSWLVLIMAMLLIIGLSCSDDDDDVTNSSTGATVTGTITLPATASGKDLYVLIDDDFDGGNGEVRMVQYVCGDLNQYSYEFTDIPAGTYFIYAAVFVVGDGSGEPVTGDYMGIYGGTLANPPMSANATVPSSGTANFDITLEVMP